MQHLTLIEHPLVQHKLTILRDKTTPSSVFAQVLSEIGQLLAYDVTRDLALTDRQIQTPICAMDAPYLSGKKLALISVLRAGNGLLDGVRRVIPTARVGFVGLARDEQTLRPAQYYQNLPNHLDQRNVIVLDPMLATGNSAAAALDVLKSAGANSLRFMALLGAPEGVKRLKQLHPDVPITMAALDERLNEHGYIVPGLGDAGDRIFGTN